MQNQPSLLSQFELYFEHTEDYQFLNQLFGEHKRVARAIKAQKLSVPVAINSLRRILKTK